MSASKGKAIQFANLPMRRLSRTHAIVCANMRQQLAHMCHDHVDDGRSLGSPGIDSLRWLLPVCPGDVLSVQMEVLDTIPSKSCPNIGVIVSKVSVSNHKKDVVMEFVSKGFFARQQT